MRDVQKALDFVKRNRALVTLGIKPSRPETGYGYIQSSDTVVDDFTKVKTFTEKPDLELAKVFMESVHFLICENTLPEHQGKRRFSGL